MPCEPFNIGGMTGIICTGRASRPRKKPMPFPETLDELQRYGYVFQGTGSCRGCGVQMAWFLTPNGKKMPMTRKGADLPRRFESHHAVCPERGRFKRT
jgi:hypothetical protein